MTQIKSLDDLKKLKEQVQSKLDIREKSIAPEELVQIKIGMSTCGIVAGAKDIMEYLMEKAEKQGVDAVFTQNACIGFCKQEPIVEVILPNKEAVIFGNVDKKRADEIIEKFIANGTTIEGIIKK